MMPLKYYFNPHIIYVRFISIKCYLNIQKLSTRYITIVHITLRDYQNFSEEKEEKVIN